MIFQLIKKELLMFWRRPRELVVLLLMPFVLISILGSALGAINDSSSPNLDIKLAIIQNDDIEGGEEFIVNQINALAIPDAEKAAAIGAVNSFNPIQILLQDVLESEELKNLIEVEYVEGNITEKEAQKYTGILEIPSGFTEKFYQNAYFSSGEVPALKLKLNESTSLEGSILKDIFTSFQEEISFWTATQSLGINAEELQEQLIQQVGKTESVSERKAINSVSYYAIGMCVMFMFYVAGNAANISLEEKQNQIFGRVLLANMPIPIFFSGIFVSTLILSFLQINILFGLSALIHKVIWPSVFDYLSITFLLSVMVGAFAVLLSAISYRINTGGAVQVFTSFLIPMIAFVGGSFVPVAQLGGFFEVISKYSPGGAGISAYYKIMQGYSLADVSIQITAISVTSILLLLVAFLIQPKRGESI